MPLYLCSELNYIQIHELLLSHYCCAWFNVVTCTKTYSTFCLFLQFINMFNFDNVFCSVFIWKRFTKRMFECYRGASFPLKCLFLYTVYCLPKSYNQLVLLLSFNQYLFAPFNSFINKVWSKVKVFLVFLAFCDCSIARQSSFYLGYPKRNVSTVYVWPNRFC